MILRALSQLAVDRDLVSDPDFPLGRVSYYVTVTRDGIVRGITDVRRPEPGAKKPTLQPRAVAIPYQPGRSGTKAPAQFLVDNAKYVFGLPTPEKVAANEAFSEVEGREKSRWFRDLVAECASDTDDEGVKAVLLALDGVASGRQSVTLPDDCKPNEQFAFVYEPDVDVAVHMRPAIRAWWQARRRGSGDGDAEDARFECIVSGQRLAESGLFPLVKKVPGGLPGGVSLVSYNESAFESYGLRGNENGPISRASAEYVAAALRRLVDPAFPDPRPGRAAAPMPRWHVRIGDDTLVCFWASGGESDDFLDNLGGILEAEDEADVAELYRSVWRGRSIAVGHPGAFFALTLSGAQGRLVVRDWFEDRVADVAMHVAQYFSDLDMVRNTPPLTGREPRQSFPLGVLLAALAPLGKRENVPVSLGTAFVSAALRGAPLPVAVLQRAVERARAEAGRSAWADLERRDARAALIKAVLLRHTSTHSLSRDMDPTNSNAGYLCGRLMAIVERLQYVALGDVNAGVVDRYFGAASATPRAVFVRLLRNAQHHSRKAQDDPARAGTAVWLKRQIDEIADHFDPKHNGFPAFLPLEDQGMFILGYHQQRHVLWSKRSDGGSESSATAA